jgi:hypothetical protein
MLHGGGGEVWFGSWLSQPEIDSCLHIEPSAFVRGKDAARWSAGRPDIVKVPARGLEHRHGRQHISDAIDAQKDAERCLAVIFYL